MRTHLLKTLNDFKADLFKICRELKEQTGIIHVFDTSGKIFTVAKNGDRQRVKTIKFTEII